MLPSLGLRKSEWLALTYFGYVVVIAPFFHHRPALGPQPLLLFIAVFALFAGLAAAERGPASRAVNYTRDWVPIVVTLLAFREMNLFRPAAFPHVHEQQWILQDKFVLIHQGLQRAIESAGWLVPFYLETCYFLVYGTAAFSVAAFYFVHERQLIDRFYLIYLAGTLGTYTMFPFIPSEPPRILYPHVAPPTITTFMRDLNLLLLRTASIQMSVYPSAHVSSAFSAAWALLSLQPRRKWLGAIAVVYAISVAVATVYGRYHYVADALAGFLVSVVAFVLVHALSRHR